GAPEKRVKVAGLDVIDRRLMPSSPHDQRDAHDYGCEIEDPQADPEVPVLRNAVQEARAPENPGEPPALVERSQDCRSAEQKEPRHCENHAGEIPAAGQHDRMSAPISKGESQ